METHNNIAVRPTCSRANRAIETGLLRTFLAILETGSLQKAAETVCRTQAAVSCQVQKLEEVLDTGYPLFEKSGRRLILTDRGKRLAGHAKIFMQMHDHIYQDMMDPSDLHQLDVFQDAFDDGSTTGTFAPFVQINDDRSPGGRKTVTPIKRFEDNLQVQHRDILDSWREHTALNTPFTLSHLSEKGLILDDDDLGMQFDAEGGTFHCVGAAGIDASMTIATSCSAGATWEQMVDSESQDARDIAERRIRLYQTVVQARVPAYFTGNGVALTKDEYCSTEGCKAYDRLLLPYRTGLEAAGNMGIIQISIPNESRSYAALQNGKAGRKGSFMPEIVESPVVAF